MAVKKKFNGAGTKGSALGKGLDALISTEAVRTEGSSTISEIRLDQIEANPNQPRRDFDEEALQELANSISEIGIIQPITLHELGNDRYMIIAGERRWRASQKAGKQTIPAYIKKADDSLIMEMALVENIQREDLNAIEVALAYQQLMEKEGMTQEKVAQRVGKSRATVANSIRLLKLPAQVQVALQKKHLDMGHARALLAIDSPSQQVKLYEEIVKNGYSVRQVEAKVKSGKGKGKGEKKGGKSKGKSAEKKVARPAFTKAKLIAEIRKKQSFLCVGLDSDIKKLPQCVMGADDPIFEFNKQIIDATAPYCVAYKPNLAFYEAMGVKGLIAFEKTVNYLKTNYPEQFIIADAKRGDIGNTSKLYARTFFEEYDLDALTVAPYMGEDSVKPFLEYEGKWVILLALTSNKGSYDFQTTETGDNEKLFEKVLRKSQEWANDESMMYVVGATQGSAFADIRKIVPNHFLLVPGVGAQGGSLQEVCKYGMNKDCGLLVNSSRGIIFASSEIDFAQRAAEEAVKIQQEMAKLL